MPIEDNTKAEDVAAIKNNFKFQNPLSKIKITVVRSYEKFDLSDANVSWAASSQAFKYTNIPNPTGKYGNRYTNTIGKLYKLG